MLCALVGGRCWWAGCGGDDDQFLYLTAHVTVNSVNNVNNIMQTVLTGRSPLLSPLPPKLAEFRGGLTGPNHLK